MGLADELRYRDVVCFRRSRWDYVCQLSTRLLDSNFKLSTDNQIVLRVISVLNGLKTSPRGSFDRFLIRELNNLEVKIGEDFDLEFCLDVKSEISSLMRCLVDETNFKPDNSRKSPQILSESELFLEVVRSLPIGLNPDYYSNINDINEGNSVELSIYRNNLEKIKFYTFIVGLFTLLSCTNVLKNRLKRLVQTIYYFNAQLDIYPYSWLTDQLKLNYSDLLLDYPKDVIGFRQDSFTISHMNMFKEEFIELCKPLIASVYHDLFLKNWHMLNEASPVVREVSSSPEVFCRLMDSRVLIGLTGYNITHSISIDSFNDLHERFASKSERSSEKKFSIFHAPSDVDLEFFKCLWLMLTRYETISEPGSRNMESSIPKAVSDYAANVLKCDLECFASPLNVQSKYYCSLFSDTDAPFGSLGNFFEYVNKNLIKDHTSIIVNPPFELKVLEKTVEIILELLSSDNPLLVIFVGPLWYTDFYNKIVGSKFTRFLYKLSSKSYKYRDIDGFEYAPVHESFCSVLQNNYYISEYNEITEEQKHELALAWSCNS